MICRYYKYKRIFVATQKNYNSFILLNYKGNSYKFACIEIVKVSDFEIYLTLNKESKFSFSLD